MVVPRIVSSSMTPTIQEGDRLELSPPSSLTVGAIVVFRTENMFICHRITAIDAHGMLTTQGDAADGPGEAVRSASVIGVVRGVMREGRSITLWWMPRQVLRLNRLAQPQESRSDSSRTVSCPDGLCLCNTCMLSNYILSSPQENSDGGCVRSCTTPLPPLPFQDRLVQAPKIPRFQCREERTTTDSLRSVCRTLAIGAI